VRAGSATDEEYSFQRTPVDQRHTSVRTIRDPIALFRFDSVSPMRADDRNIGALSLPPPRSTQRAVTFERLHPTTECEGVTRRRGVTRRKIVN
jgi:hypothetical protein